MRLFALCTLMVSPPAYFAMKQAAVSRHLLYQRAVEGDCRGLRGTWHEAALRWVYPL